MAEADEDTEPGSVLASVSNALVKLHKEQFGRGPTKARSGWTGENTLVVTLHEALLPAEQALVDIGHIERVQEARLSFQEATRGRFIDLVEQIVGREVRSFASACDPRTETVWEVYEFVA